MIPFEGLGLILAISVVACVLISIIRYDGWTDLTFNCLDYIVVSVLSVYCISLIVFVIVASNTPYEVEKITEYRIQTTDNGTQFIEHKNEFVNLNFAFGTVFNDEDEIVVQTYKEGPYFGILYFRAKWDMTIKED